MSNSGWIGAVVCAALFATLGSSANAEPKGAVTIFQYIAPSGEVDPPPPGFTNEYLIDPTLGEFDANTPQIQISLPLEANPVVFNRLRGETRANGHLWVGRATTTDIPSVITVSGGYLAGALYTANAQFAIQPFGVGTRLGRVDQAFAIDDVVEPLPARPGPVRFADTRSAWIKAPVAAKQGFDPIRVLVPYTTAARIAAGGQAQITAVAQAAIDAGNQIFINSGVPQVRLELSRTMEANYPDNYPAQVFLPDIRDDPDVIATRNSTYSDVVLTIVENMDFGGIAYANVAASVDQEASAFGLVRRGNLAINSFSHEIGHIQGMAHSSQFDIGLFPWAHAHVGFVEPPFVQGFATVMAISLGKCGSSPPCFHVPYFSNPTLSFPGAPFLGRALGTVGTEENYRVAADTLAVANSFRATTVCW